MASYGFHYKSTDVSPHKTKNASCKCRFMPGIDGETRIDGYDKDDCREKVESINAITKSMGFNSFQTRRFLEVFGVEDPRNIDLEMFKERWNVCKFICQGSGFETVLGEAVHHSANWLLYGETVHVKFSYPSLRGIIAKHELETAQRYSNLGFDAIFVKDYESYIGENGLVQRIGKADLASGVELKTILEAKSISRLDKDLRNASGKIGMNVCLIDNSLGLLNDGDIRTNIERFMRNRGVNNCIVLFSDGSATRFLV